MKYSLTAISKNENNVIIEALITPITYIVSDGIVISNPTDEYLEVNNIGKNISIQDEPKYNPDIQSLFCYFEEDATTIYKKYNIVEKTFTINDVISKKLPEIKQLCKDKIYAGFDFDTFGGGNLHYTLTEYQQSDIKTLMTNITLGATKVLWHDSSRILHEIYTAEQFTKLFNAAMKFVVSCKIRSDFLEQNVLNLCNENKFNDALNVNWDTELSEEVNAEIQEQINIMLGIPDPVATPTT